ncbi:ribose 5-phosphate isomerase B [Pararhodospirillum oryzae]|uniref:Ribose 5-phosphate isomerase B n=1 Tax=Pararhodospirillum oryzae TaxID=478448 RepID=A0A512HAJ0_9PROT|nr:ribose 5-phosphate isomerase B [Pararhodospirillum oryzae]GEO82469.1 ribose 5-phosphate isomerase B [Pararhodospirillum oryzae]
MQGAPSPIAPEDDQPRPVVALASDHGALELRALLVAHLQEQGWPVLDLGTHGPGSVDYPDIANLMAETMRAGKAGRGVLLCGTGIGISIAINRHADMRGALVHDAYGARLCRLHNDANVLVLGGRTTGPEIAKECVDLFLSTPFEGGRHARRVAKLGGATPA